MSWKSHLPENAPERRNDIVVAKEFRGTNGSKTRRFRVFESPRELYENYGERVSWHEIVYAERPARLYLDLESKTMNVVEFELEKSRVVSAVRDKIEECFEISEARFVESVAHRQSYCSCHLVFPDVWFQRAGDVRGFVSELPDSPILDCAVYSETRCKSLRMPYSWKLTEDGTLKYPLLVEGTLKDKSPAKLFDRMITVLPSASVKMHVYEDRKRKRAKTTRETYDESTDGGKLLARIDRVHDYLIRRAGTQSLTLREQPDAKGRWTWSCTPGLYCPKKKRPHVGNCTYVHGRIWNGRVRLKMICLDEECKAAWRYRFEDELTAAVFDV